MAYERQARVSERITASGTVNGGKPVKKLFQMHQLTNGTGAANIDWYNDVSAVAANKKGGLTSAALSTWASQTVHEQEFSTALYVNFGANTAEVIATYIP